MVVSELDSLYRSPNCVMLLSLKVHETRSRKHAAEEGKASPKRQKAEKTMKLKGQESDLDGKENATKEFIDFCKTIREHLSVEDMRKILEANEQDASGSEDAVVPSWYRLFEILNESFNTVSGQPAFSVLTS